jgi:DNA-binding PadR family transcriptional regulator
MKIDVTMALLAALRGWGPASTLDLIARVKEKSLGSVAPSVGAAYVALQAAQLRGLVRSYKLEAGARGRPGRVYELTARGRRRANADRELVAAIFDG